MNWNRSKKNNIFFVEYDIQGTKVLVGSRPDNGTTIGFYNSIDAWLNVSEDYIVYPSDSINQFNPWIEWGPPQEELIFATLLKLHQWITIDKKKKIYLHCLAGSHRSPSIFGLYLKAFWPNECESIVNTALKGKDNVSNPLYYAQTYLNELPYLGNLIFKINENFSSQGVSLEGLLYSSKNSPEYISFIQKRKINWRLNSFSSFKNLIVNNLKNIGLSSYRFIHKILNTKKGQVYKKFKL